MHQLHRLSEFDHASRQVPEQLGGPEGPRIHAVDRESEVVLRPNRMPRSAVSANEHRRSVVPDDLERRGLIEVKGVVMEFDLDRDPVHVTDEGWQVVVCAELPPVRFRPRGFKPVVLEQELGPAHVGPRHEQVEIAHRPKGGISVDENPEGRALQHDALHVRRREQSQDVGERLQACRVGVTMHHPERAQQARGGARKLDMRTVKMARQQGRQAVRVGLPDEAVPVLAIGGQPVESLQLGVAGANQRAAEE